MFSDVPVGRVGELRRVIAEHGLALADADAALDIPRVHRFGCVQPRDHGVAGNWSQLDVERRASA